MRTEEQGFIQSVHVQAAHTSFVAIEIDVEAFENENQARMRRGTNGYVPQDIVEFQYAGYVFSIGFLQRCSKCGHVGPRKEFSETENPPWKCPKCKGSKVFRTMESERIELPEVIASHGYRNCRVYPNKISTDGQTLIEKDNSQAPIRLLQKVSRLDGRTGEQEVVRRQFSCSFCGDEFLTLKMLQEHRASEHNLGGGAIAEVPKPGEKPAVSAGPAVSPAPQRAARPAAASAAVAVAEDEHETISGNPEAERRSPAELKAMIEKAKAKGVKAGGPEAE